MTETTENYQKKRRKKLLYKTTDNNKHYKNGSMPKNDKCNKIAIVVIGISFKTWLSAELSTCPALKNSVLPVLVVVETFTEDEPTTREFVWMTQSRSKLSNNIQWF